MVWSGRYKDSKTSFEEHILLKITNNAQNRFLKNKNQNIADSCYPCHDSVVISSPASRKPASVFGPVSF